MKRVWLDNRITSKSKALISAFDHGFLYGEGLFETMRCYEGRVFALEKHLRRLIKSCPILDMKPPSVTRLKKGILRLIEANHLTKACIRLNVYKGCLGDSPQGARVFIFARKLSLPAPAQYKKGFSAILFKDERIGISPLNSIKSLNHYFYNRLSRLARLRGFDEVLFLNSYKEVVEGSRTNLFVVKKGKVLTPKISCGCLPGVTRLVVMELLKGLGVPVIQSKILPEELFSQDEMFVTNSLIEIMPVTRLDRSLVGKGGVGPLTQKIMQAYQEKVEKECQLR